MFSLNFTVKNTSVTTVWLGLYILHALNLYLNLVPPDWIGQNPLKAHVRTQQSFDDSSNRAWFSREVNG